MIEEILPTRVFVTEAFGDRDDAALFPEEHAFLVRAVERRRREFANVRACARDALARLSVPPVPILPGSKGAPQWPAGIVGSMTHCDGYCACAVASAKEFQTIGIDAELDAPLPDEVYSLVALPEEQAALRQHAARDPSVNWDRLLFSAKEATYKSWFPIVGCWLGFDQALITIDPSGSFEVRVLVPGSSDSTPPLDRLAGRWLAQRGLLLTAIARPRSAKV